MLIRTTNAIGQTTKYGRDLSTNLLTSYTDSLERATRFTYDNHGNLTSAIDPAGNVTSFQYEPTYNFLRKFTDALGNELDVKYDLHGNINKILNPLKDEITIQYDQYGQIISISDPLNNTATYTYDASGNLVEVIDPLGNKLTGDYDQASRLTAFTDTKGRTLRVTYNPSDRITHITNSVGKDTEFSYDLNRNLLSVKDANNRTVRTYTYDARNQLTTVTDQLGYTEIYRYNLNGNLISFTDRKEQPTEFVYDPLNRKIRTIYPDGTTTNYTYDSVGRLTTLDNSVSGPIEFVYTTFRCPTCPKTKLDTIIQEITRFGVTDYTYDELGRRKTMSVAGAPVMEYRYDAASRLVRITQEGMGNLDIDHDKADRMTSLTFSNGITTNFVFDQVNRLLNIRHSNMAGIVEDIVYAYDTTKERISFHTLNTQSQLPKEVTATYDSANRMLTFNDENLHYDVNGNLVEETEATGTITYVWNARDQLIGMHGPSLTASFKYDAAGRRIERNINGKTIQYLYDGLNIVAELENGSITASYVGGLRTDEIFARRDRSGIRYFLRDGLGSTIVLTDHNGTSKTTYSYAPYGNTLVTGEQTDNPFQYTGRENDGTGLYYYRMRYYSPELQRFISEDPLRLLGGINFYSYVANDPINLIDPYGFYALIDDAIFIAGGAVVGLAGQAFSDWLFGNSSGWEDYIAAAIGGAVGGEALLYTGPIGAGALGGAANNASKQLLRNLSGKQCGFNFVSLGLDTGIGALTGLIPTPRIQGITSGNNNYAAIFHQMVTKFQRGHISNLSFETALKMLIGRTFETSFVPGIGIGAIASGISSW
jgi:RHS repeat-associated protein